MKKLLAALLLSMSMSATAEMFVTIDEDTIGCYRSEHMNNIITMSTQRQIDIGLEYLNYLVERDQCGFTRAGVIARVLRVEGEAVLLESITHNGRFWVSIHQINLD